MNTNMYEELPNIAIVTWQGYNMYGCTELGIDYTKKLEYAKIVFQPSSVC